MRRYFTTETLVDESDIRNIISQHAYALPDMDALEPLLDKIGNAHIVMLGEASHGTHEYYTWRAYITRRLIEEKGFNFIAVEGDWPDCYRVNRYVKGYEANEKRSADVLHTFNRWPTWMWANHEMAVFTKWLKSFNASLPATKKVGFYGLDVYSLWESLDSIMAYLRKHDPAALRIAEEALRCFEPFSKHEGIGYAKASRFVPDLCQNEVVEMLREIREKLPTFNTDHENVFNLEQNARVVANAEEYYRTMVMGGPHSWNLRDKHMADTLDHLMEFHGPDAKVVVWAHNTHIGDARATDMVDEGMFNLGEIARIKHHDKGVYLVGFGSYKGTVVAADQWSAPMEIIDVPPARKQSWEDQLHQAVAENKLMLLDELIDNQTMMENHFGHRAIGVVYDPRREAYGNYVPSIIPLRYNAFIYLDETRALHPLHMETDTRQMPETYPSGM
jgi:erythromycin esterase-like protein